MLSRYGQLHLMEPLLIVVWSLFMTDLLQLFIRQRICMPQKIEIFSFFQMFHILLKLLETAGHLVLKSYG